MHEKKFYFDQSDVLYFKRAFLDMISRSSQDITFKSLREIANLCNKFNKVIISSCLDKIIKRMTSQNEDDIFISINKINTLDFDDYFEYLEYIALEQNKFLNEKDPEMENLFNILCFGDIVIYRKKISEIIENFELPLSLDEFFLPIGKKEEINFNDFCYLFKANKEANLFLKTFAQSFYGSN
jgi:hypothetical protein